MNVCVADEAALGWDDPRWAQAGITYRMLDYWTVVGYVRVVGDNAQPGSGFKRAWSAYEYQIARRIRRLTRAGVRLDVAAAAARKAVEVLDAEGSPLVYQVVVSLDDGNGVRLMF